MYDDAENFIAVWMRKATPDLELLPQLVGAWSRSQFLFDKEITLYLRKLWLDSVKADFANKIISGEVLGDRAAAIQTKHDLLLEHADFDRLREVFKYQMAINTSPWATFKSWLNTWI